MLSPFLIFSKGGEHKFIEFACLYCISQRAAIKLKCVFMKRFVAFLNRIPIVFFFFFFFCHTNPKVVTKPEGRKLFIIICY